MTARKGGRCEMFGRCVHDGYKHVTTRGYDSRYRCASPAAYETSVGQRLCAACRKHNLELARAEKRIAVAQIDVLTKAKRLRNRSGAARAQDGEGKGRRK